MEYEVVLFRFLTLSCANEYQPQKKAHKLKIEMSLKRTADNIRTFFLKWWCPEFSCSNFFIHSIHQRYAPHPMYILDNFSTSVASLMQCLTTPLVDSCIFEITPFILTWKIVNQKFKKKMDLIQSAQLTYSLSRCSMCWTLVIAWESVFPLRPSDFNCRLQPTNGS